MSTHQEQISKLEKEIQSKKEALHNLRKQSPPIAVENYLFEDAYGKNQSLLDLFDGRDELILISNMGKGCKYCTLWADGFNGLSKPLNDRASFVVTSPDPVDVMVEFARSRKWDMRMFSHHKSPFIKDMGFVNDAGVVQPGVIIFTRKGNEVFRVNHSNFGPGDNFCVMWDMIDMLPSGINAWQPKYTYT